MEKKVTKEQTLEQEIIATWKSEPVIREEFKDITRYEAFKKAEADAVETWEAEPAIRREFKNKSAYVAFKKAEAVGKVKIIGGK